MSMRLALSVCPFHFPLPLTLRARARGISTQFTQDVFEDLHLPRVPKRGYIKVAASAVPRLIAVVVLPTPPF